MPRKYDRPLTMAEVRDMQDSDIDFGEIPEWTDEMLRNAKTVYPEAGSKRDAKPE